jgi:hypothetical protein
VCWPRLCNTLGMDRLVEQLLPYWSIGINVLLSLTMFPEAREAGAEYGRRFASVISIASDFLLR